jgi:hypothetical protein
VIFRLTPRYSTPWQVSLIVIIGLIALSISVLERRVRGRGGGHVSAPIVSAATSPSGTDR